MKKSEIKTESSNALVERFEQVAAARGLAMWNNDPKSANKAFDEETAIVRELVSRNPDELRLLLPLLKSPDAWVRCYSAILLLFVVPDQAELALERVVREEQRSLRATASLTLDQWREGQLKRWWVEHNEG